MYTSTVLLHECVASLHMATWTEWYQDSSLLRFAYLLRFCLLATELQPHDALQLWPYSPQTPCIKGIGG